MNYIDAHVHVWTDDLERYPIADGFRRENMKPPRFLPEDILAHAKPSGVDRVVLIQMSFYQFDNTYMLDVIEAAPETFRGVAIVDWNGPDPTGPMRDLFARGVRGFRVYSGAQEPGEWLGGDGMAAMFRCCAELGAGVCPLIEPSALPALDQACERFPDTLVVIDHICRIGCARPIEDAHVEALCRMARHPRVMVKLSAFYALGEKRPPHLDLTDMIRRVCDAFGPQRLMWASDCPYQVQDETYEDGVSLIRDRLDCLSNEDKEWILRRTAEGVFYS